MAMKIYVLQLGRLRRLDQYLACREIVSNEYQVDRDIVVWFKDLGPSKDSAYMLSAVADLTSALLDVPFRRALALSQLCSPLATPWVSGELDFPQHRNLIRASTLHCFTKTRELLYSRLLLQLLQGSRHHDNQRDLLRD
jgi:hypothetical protein